ncbi:hypothetical protein DL764_010302 [Monosporascus ibericus]|uniref:Uncharacterized protein n=1 Tax=Monosporascus ibericus TaxID=155417 RepID=A0A4Q4SVN8_9PEZI|nr:hypothetical protein DL764_010302 [Monosporascus ibericus]
MIAFEIIKILISLQACRDEIDLYELGWEQIYARVKAAFSGGGYPEYEPYGEDGNALRRTPRKPKKPRRTGFGRGSHESAPYGFVIGKENDTAYGFVVGGEGDTAYSFGTGGEGDSPS